MIMKHARLLASIAMVGFILAACGAPPVTTVAPNTPAKIKLLLTFQPNVQFAPFYVAIEKGFFQQRDIEVEIVHLAESDVTKLVASNEAQFGVVSGEQVLLARQEGLPVVYFFTWFQQYPVAVAVKADRGIEQAKQLRGLRIGIPLKQGASHIGLVTILRAGELTESDIYLQEIGFTQVPALMEDKVDGVVVYTNNEPLQLAAQGVNVNLIAVTDYTSLVSNGLITNEKTVSENPDLVKRVAAAFNDGLQFTIDNPDEAFEIATIYVEGLSDPDIAVAQKNVLLASIELWRVDRLGENDPDAWDTMQEVMLEMRLLDTGQDAGAAFTDSFLP